MRQRVGIIGAGPGGLFQLLAFEKAKHKSIDLICFERQADWGGAWNYTPCSGFDEYGEPVHSSMYRHLWSNGPKETIELDDYTFEEHFGQQCPSYVPRAVMRDYLIGRAKRGDVRKYIRFRTAVRWISFDESTDQFNVTVKDLVNNTYEHWTFDYVVVATGHYHCPKIPDFHGISEFPGRVLHAHDFRGAEEFINQRLLLIGASVSAEDIAVQCFKFGARSITISYRTQPLAFTWPEGIKEVPLLQYMVGNKAHFKDGSSAEVDAIIFCTGYRHHFPFITESLRLQCPYDYLYPSLYKGCFWINQPRLVYLGMGSLSLLTLNVQANLVRDFVHNSFTLPDVAVMKKSVKEWCVRVDPAKSSIELYLQFQRDYLNDLLQSCVPDTAPKIDVNKLHAIEVDVENKRAVNVLTYRDISYQSIYTGAQAPKHHTLWFQNIDDSMDSYFGPIIKKESMHKDLPSI